MLDIDQVVTKNFPKVAAKPWLFSKPVKSALRMLFHERELQKFQAQYPHLQGLDFVEQILEHFDFSYTINAKELERIPSTGRVVIVANHPLGTLDAAVLLKLVGQVRTDVKAVANQVLSSIQPIHGLLLPVDNMGGNTKPSQLKAVYQHLQHEGAVIIFPAGEVSRLSPSGIKDGKWNRSFLQIASASRAPILPIYVNGRNSAFFYALSWLARPLSTLWLVREMYKQTKRSVAVLIGKLIPVEALEQVKLPMDAKAKLMKKHLYRLGSHKPALFETISPIAHPEKRQALRQELQACERLGQTQDGKQIYLAEYHADSSLMREIGRLREIAFRAVGEGTGSRRDVDKYDSHCFQLVLWDEQDLEIVGAYRLCKIQEVLQTNPNDTALYSQTLFHFSPAMQPMMQQGLELGRSFVQPRYWGRRSLDYLWYGIGAFLRQHPEYRYLLGPVSLSDHYPAAAKDLLVCFYSLYFGDKDCKVTAKFPYRIAPHTQEELAKQFSGQDYKKDFIHLKSSLKHMGCTVPTLYKQYTEICQPEGVSFLDFNIDPDFANCIDGLVVVDLTQLHAKTRKRYIEWEVK